MDNFLEDHTKPEIGNNKIFIHRVLAYLKLLRTYYDAPHDVTSEAFATSVEKSFDWIGIEREDIFVMTFYAWLKAKMQSRPLYEVTLELVESSI